jgi:hypothetical protein
VHEELSAWAAQAVALIRKYEKGGPSYSTLLELRKLRHQHLAHHQVGRKPIGIVEEEKIEKYADALYEDSAMLISLLLHVVERTTYDPRETAGVYEFYAKLFWEAVTAERTENHPRQRWAKQSLIGQTSTNGTNQN